MDQQNNKVLLSIRVSLGRFAPLYIHESVYVSVFRVYIDTFKSNKKNEKTCMPNGTKTSNRIPHYSDNNKKKIEKMKQATDLTFKKFSSCPFHSIQHTIFLLRFVELGALFRPR